MENKIRVVPDACCFLSDVQMITLAEQQLRPQYTAKVLREHGAEQRQKALPEDGAKQARESLAKHGAKPYELRSSVTPVPPLAGMLSPKARFLRWPRCCRRRSSLIWHCS